MEDPALAVRLARLNVRRICLLKPSAFGDVVQTLPLLPVLRERFPTAEVSWVVNRELQDLLTGQPDLAEIIPFERRGGWSTWRTLLGRLHARKFDVVFDLQGLLRTAVMSWATRAPLRIGLETAREGSHLACHFLLRDTGRLVPAHARYWRVAEALGLGDTRASSLISVLPEDLRWAESFANSRCGPLLAIHPGARWATKQWPIAQFAEVAARAVARYGFSLVLIGGRGERPANEELAREILLRQPGAEVHNLSGETSFKQLTALLQRCALVLSNDSGPMHLAAATQTPVIGVFTCTSAERSGPAGPLHAFASTTLPCAASYCKVCPKTGVNHLACFRELTADRVWQTLDDHWQTLQARSVILRAA